MYGSPGTPTTTEIRPALFAGPTERQLSRRTASETGSRGGAPLSAEGGVVGVCAVNCAAVDRDTRNSHERGVHVIAHCLDEKESVSVNVRSCARTLQRSVALRQRPKPWLPE